MQFFDRGVSSYWTTVVSCPSWCKDRWCVRCCCSCCSLENPGHYFLSPFLTVPLRGVYASVIEAFGRISQHFLCEVDTDAVLGHGVGVPVVVQRQVFWSRQCLKLFGGLVGVQYDKLLMYLCDAVASSLHGALLCAMPGSTVNTCSVTAPGCVGRIVLIFYVKGNSDPEVVSVLLSGALNGEVCTVDIPVAFRAGGRTWKLDITPTSSSYLGVLCSLFRFWLNSCLRRVLRRGGFFGSPQWPSLVA